MEINLTNHSFYFTVFYSLAFFTAFLILIWEGYKRKFPIIPWILLLIFSIIFFIVGTKIFTYSKDEWLLMIRHATVSPTSGKIVLGGIILGFTALFILKPLLGIKQNVFDSFAIVLPLCMGIQRIGCFLNGCCFGKPTSLIWGIRYPVNTLPHYHHFKSGLIGSNDLLSLQIHPVQLYEIAGVLFVAFIVYKSRKLWKANGSLFAFSILLCSLAHFITEFFRDNFAHTTGGEMWGVFNQIQWVMLIVMAASSLILFYREKNFIPVVKQTIQSSFIGLNSGLFIFILAAMLFWAVRYWFTLSELLTVFMVFTISGLIFFILILREIASSRSKMIYAGLAILPLLITGQTIPQSIADSSLVVRTKRISFGLSGGNFVNDYLIGTSSDGCTEGHEYEYFKEKYTMGGVGYSILNEYPDKKYTTNYGLNLYVGNNKEIMESSGAETTTTLFGLNPYYKIDTKWVGFGAGIHVGNMVYSKISGSDVEGTKTGLIKSSVFPLLYARIGPPRIFFMDFHWADQFPTPFPGFQQQLGLGTGFGSKNGTNLRIGVVLPEEEGYLSLYLPLNKNFTLEPMFVSQEGNSQFSLGLHYNISSKTSYQKKK